MLKPLLIAGTIAGTLDGLAAVIMYVAKTGNDPLDVFRYIASGVFGEAAFGGGILMGLCGILFHYIIAFGWTLLFFWLAMKFRFLTKNWALWGVAYGIFVWFMMNRVIVPHTLVPDNPGPKQWSVMVKAALVLIFCIGLPVSFLARKNLRTAD